MGKLIISCSLVRVLSAPPRIPTPEEISRPSGNYRPISRLVWRELRLRQGLCELLGDVSSPSSLRTKIGFPETEDSGSKRRGSNAGQLTSEGQASGDYGSAARAFSALGRSLSDLCSAFGYIAEFSVSGQA